MAEPLVAERAFRLESGSEGLRALVFDAPGSRVNLLTEAVIRELVECLEHLRADPDARSLLVTSGKPGQFIAGADVAAIRDVREASDGQAKAAAGQAAFQMLADLPMPTCAAIDGACMGGGLELALACRHRLASDAAGTSLGLPEVRLGILPAFGGTTRLPRLIGLVPALDLLLTGRAVDGRRAFRLGLVDDVLPAEDFRARAERAFAALMQGARARRTKRTRRGSPTWMRWLVDRNPIGRGFVIGRARKRTLAETRGHYPAPLRILDVLARALGRPVPESLRLEAEAAGELLVSPVTRNLTALFFLMERAKKDPPADQARAVSRVGVLGAGVMGGGIAALFARAGLPARLKDVRQEAIGQGLARAHELFERDARRGRISERDLRQRMALLSGALDYSGFGRADFVVEAVVESLDIKRRVLAEVASRAPENAILASNTSSLRLEDLSEGLPHPERLVGLHFFNPVHRMPLVEVVVWEKTADYARDTAVALARRVGKTPVVVRSSPGFLVNRILMPYLEEGLRLFQAGVPIEELDRALVEFGMPMGPLELLDEVGLDVALKVAGVLTEAFPTAEGRPDVLRPMVDGGRLGKKGGRGFYRYVKGSKRPDPAVYTLVSAPKRSAVQAGRVAWAERLLLAMINEAAKCLESGIVSSSDQVDLAMIMGTGFPAFRGGLLRYADTLGIGHVAERLRALAEAEGSRFAPSPLILEKAAARARFREDFPR